MKEIKAFNSIRQSFKTRQVKYGGYAALITLAVIAGLILINLLVGQFSPQVDMTSARLFSLSEQTIKLLDSINSPVKFYGLWRPGEENTDVISVINLYLSKSRNISFEVIDPDRNPGFVARYDRNRTGIQRGSLIVEGKNGFRIINPYDMYELAQNQQGGSTVTGVSVERRITSALLFSETGNTPVIYEITGHGETPLSALGYQNVLEQENFSVKSLNLLTAIIPTDASALMLINPTGDLNSQEADKLLNYLEKGGRLLIMADYNIRELTNLNTVLASYGLALDYGVIVESDLNYQIASVPFSLVPDAVDHEITKLLLDKTRTPVLLIGAMSLSTLETRRRTIEISPLLVSSRNAFLRTDLNNISNVKTPADISGPLTIGAVVTDPSWVQDNEAQTRLAVFASGTLLDIATQGFDANRDIFINSLVWLENQPENITVRSKSLFIMPLQLNLVQVIIFGALFIFVIPAAFFASGFIVWLKRRHL